MTVLGLVALFFGGMLLANGVPHFVKGVTGQRHMSPFGRNSSAVVNVLWGGTNFVLGGVLLWAGLKQGAAGVAQAVTAGAGALLVSLGLAHFWSKPEARLPWHKD